MKNNYYKTFVVRFYATFDEMGETNIVRGVTHLVDSIHKNSNSQNIFAAQTDARRFATDVTRYIKDAGWSTSDSLTFKELEKFTEFLAYTMLLHLTCRHVALSLNYKKDDELHEFAFKCNAEKFSLSYVHVGSNPPATTWDFSSYRRVA